MSYYPQYQVLGTSTTDRLVTGPTRTKVVTIKAGQNVTRGTVIQEGVSADVGKFLVCTADASAKYIMAEDCNAVVDTLAMVFVTGDFNPNAITLGAGATLSGVTKTFEPLSIFFSTMSK